MVVLVHIRGPRRGRAPKQLREALVHRVRLYMLEVPPLPLRARSLLVAPPLPLLVLHTRAIVNQSAQPANTNAGNDVVHNRPTAHLARSSMDKLLD